MSTLNVTNIKAADGASALTIANSTGVITNSAIPAFSANRSSALNISSTNQTVVFNAVTHNQGSHYNSGTGKFTAPVSGLYFFSAGIGVQNGSDSRYLVVSLQTSDTNYTDVLLTGRSSAIDTTGTTYDGIYISGVVPLTANQFVLCKAEMENSSACVVSDKSCYFTGYLIG